MRVAFAGLGVMGFPMAGHLARAGHEVTVFNRTPDKAAKWVETYGGRSAPTVAEAAKGAELFLLCVGAVRGLRTHPSKAKVWLAVCVSVIVTLAAIFGAVYKVTTPTIWCAYAVVGVFAVGLVLSFLVPGRQTAHTSYGELAEAERGPLKM